MAIPVEKTKCWTCKFLKSNGSSAQSSRRVKGRCVKEGGYSGTYCIDREYVSWEVK